MNSIKLQQEHQHDNLEKLPNSHFSNNHHKRKKALFSVENISFGYSKKKILKDLSIEFMEGDFTVILGPNGCGKSTLIKSLVRINLPQTGHIQFQDKLIYAPNSFEIFFKSQWQNILKTFKKQDDQVIESLKWYKQNTIRPSVFYNIDTRYKQKKLANLANKLEDLKLELTEANDSQITAINQEITKINSFIDNNEIENDWRFKLYHSLSNTFKPKNNNKIIVSRPKMLAKDIAYVPQITNFPENTTIYDFVKMGRFPHSNALGFTSNFKKENAIIEDALKKVGIFEIKDEDINSVSGGQRQKALIAMSLAQQTNTIILDEPTNHLDIKAQLEIMSLLHKLHHELNKSIILVIHDINVGIKYASKTCIMKDGKILRYGRTKDVVDSEVLLDAFGVNTIIETEDGSINITEFSLPDHEILDELHIQQKWDEHLERHENIENNLE